MDLWQNDIEKFNQSLYNVTREGSYTTSSAKAEVPQTPHGTLIIQTSVANGALPIQGAKATVTRPGGETVATLFTDNSGKTMPLRLSAPAASASQTPGSGTPYSKYNILVEKDGYYSDKFLNVPVFDGIESIQNVSLLPLGENARPDDLITDETEVLSQSKEVI